MSNIREEIFVAEGGLNYDDDPVMFKKGDTDYRLNVIPTGLGSTYVLSNMKGTTVKEHSFTHAATYDGATYTPNGSCYDVKRNAIYFFVYSDLDNHCIFRYNISDDTFDKIVWENTNLGLDIDNPVNDAFMLDDWLFFNTRSSSPRSINVEWAYYDYASYSTDNSGTYAVGDYVIDGYSRVFKCIQADTAPLTGSDAPIKKPNYWKLVSRCYNDAYLLDEANAGTIFRERSFFNTTLPLTSPIRHLVSSDTDYEFNNIRGHVFQFTYRFYIPQQGYTVTAPITKAIGTFTGETYNGEFTGEVTTDNRIRLTVYTPVVDGVSTEYDYLFDHVEILVRDAELTAWKSVVRIPLEQVVQEGNTPPSVVYDFYNSSGLEVADNADIEVPYNYLPILSSSQWSIGGERVGYAYNTEGFPNPQIDVALTHSVREVNYGSRDETSGTPVIKQTIAFEILTVRDSNLDADEEGAPYYVMQTESALTVPAGSSAGDLMVVTVDGEGNKYQKTLIGDDVASAENYATMLAALLSNSGIKFTAQDNSGWIVTTDSLSSQHTITAVHYSGTSLTSTYESRKFQTFKGGAWHPFCMYYYDSLMRRSEAIPIDPIYVPFITESGETSGTGYINRISYTVGHEAPTWASWWRFGYAGNTSVSEFWQYNIAGAGQVSAASGPRGGLSYVDITPLQGLHDDSSLSLNFPSSNIEVYSFIDGDRIRFITSKDQTAVDGSELVIDSWAASQHDYEILEYDSSTNRLYFDSGNVISDSASGVSLDYNGNDVLIEIYRPKRTGDNIVYYEVGLLKRIYLSAGVKTHSGATGSMNTGDTYLISRALSKTPTNFPNAFTDVYVESYSWSDFYVSEFWGKGKFGSSFGIGQVQLNSVRYSNKLNKTTKTSGISRFDALDYKTLSYQFGNITAIRQIGDVLKVVFPNNVASVLVNKTQFYNADKYGTSQVVKSDDILGSVNYSEEIWGSVNPESVLVVDRDMYFFDLRRKAYVRNAPNGSFPISDYKMIKYFNDKSDALISSGEEFINVRSVWDDDHGLLFVGFEDLKDPLNNEVVAFHEASNRWVTFAELDYTTTDENFAVIPDGTGSSTTPSVGLNSALTSVQSINISVKADGTLTANESFTGVDYTLKKGDVVNFTAYMESGYDASIAQFVSLKVSFSIGEMFSEGFEVLFTNGTTDYYVGSADKYTGSITITEATVMTMTFYLEGSGVPVLNNDACDIVLDVDLVRSFIPVMQSTGSGSFGLAGEDVHILFDNDTRCNFYGNQKEYSIRVYGGTESANTVKVFDAIALHTNKYWDIPTIEIPATLNYPNGMLSKIPEARFAKEEGVLRSDYLCNMKTRSSTASTNDLVNGDSLRGYIISNDLEGDETVEHTLYKVDILQTQSKF